MFTLRPHAVYRLPGVSRPLLAVPVDRGGYILYDSRLGSAAPPRFTVDSGGRLVDWHGEQTPWTAADLSEVDGQERVD